MSEQRKINHLLAQEDEPFVSMNYPQTVSLQKLLNDASKWSGKKFIMDPTLNRDVQIFARGKLSEHDAFNLLLASIETVGLRAIPFTGGIVKIVEATNIRLKI